MKLSRTLGAAVLVCAATLALAACGGSDDDAAATAAADALPDLTSQGLVSFPCGDGAAIGGTFQAPEDPWVAECWKGSPDKTFIDIANASQDAIMLASGGTDISADVCPDDAFGVGGGIACRAVLVTVDGHSAVVRTVAVLADPGTVLDGLPDEPTADQVNEALEGAAVEVLVGTQSPTAVESSSAPSASS
ncbi:hypothetical protein [Demequina sp.]|uniref:hypothetical protein n=1 Tax=Demequina sp. TaxID=2050685 RepID=UPI003D11699E